LRCAAPRRAASPASFIEQQTDSFLLVQELHSTNYCCMPPTPLIEKYQLDVACSQYKQKKLGRAPHRVNCADILTFRDIIVANYRM
jgi:hypothetical protein